MCLEDTWAGLNREPLTLNKYLFTNGNPVIGKDPSGYSTLIDINTALYISGGLAAISAGVIAPSVLVLHELDGEGMVWEGKYFWTVAQYGVGGAIGLFDLTSKYSVRGHKTKTLTKSEFLGFGAGAGACSAHVGIGES